MAAVTDYGGGIGVGYVSDAERTSFANLYGIAAPDQASVVRASRMIDRLEFNGDADATGDTANSLGEDVKLRRFEPAALISDRIGHAVVLIAAKLGDPAAAPPRLPRQPDVVRAGPVSVEYPTSTEDIKPQMSDSEILARRLGIPDPRAVDLLRPWLKLPADLLQDDRPPGTTLNVDLYVQGQNIPQRGPLT